MMTDSLPLTDASRFAQNTETIEAVEESINTDTLPSKELLDATTQTSNTDFVRQVIAWYKDAFSVPSEELYPLQSIVDVENWTNNVDYTDFSGTLPEIRTITSTINSSDFSDFVTASQDNISVSNTVDVGTQTTNTLVEEGTKILTEEETQTLLLTQEESIQTSPVLENFINTNTSTLVDTASSPIV